VLCEHTAIGLSWRTGGVWWETEAEWWCQH